MVGWILVPDLSSHSHHTHSGIVGEWASGQWTGMDNLHGCMHRLPLLDIWHFHYAPLMHR